jgi:hypothetical protein
MGLRENNERRYKARETWRIAKYVRKYEKNVLLKVTSLSKIKNNREVYGP